MTADFSMMLFLLIAGHAVADYPLQGEYLSVAKNRHTEAGKIIWPHALMAHAFIHGGFVALITGNVWIGLAETVAHAATDWFKCEGKISFLTDQAVHIGCKLLWVIVVTVSL